MGIFNVFGRKVNTDTLKLINEGDLKMDNGEFSSATQLFSKAIEIDKTNWYAYFRRGKSYQLSNDFDKAILDYKKGISLDDNFDLNRGLGESHLMKSEFGQAIPYLRKALEKLTKLDEINGGNSKWDKANIYNNLAVGYYNVGDSEKAKDCCMNGIKIDDSYAGNYGILGSLCLEQDLLQEGMNFLRMAAKLGDQRAKDILGE